MPATEFESWVKELVRKHFGNSFQRFATEVDVTYSALKRSVRNGSTSVETLLRICLVTGEDPKTVFTIANKLEIYELITQLFGGAARLEFSQRARELAQQFDALEDEGAKGFLLDALEGWTATALKRAQNAGPSIARTPAVVGRSTKRGNR